MRSPSRAAVRRAVDEPQHVVDQLVGRGLDPGRELGLAREHPEHLVGQSSDRRRVCFRSPDHPAEDGGRQPGGDVGHEIDRLTRCCARGGASSPVADVVGEPGHRLRRERRRHETTHPVVVGRRRAEQCVEPLRTHDGIGDARMVEELRHPDAEPGVAQQLEARLVGEDVQAELAPCQPRLFPERVERRVRRRRLVQVRHVHEGDVRECRAADHRCNVPGACFRRVSGGPAHSTRNASAGRMRVAACAGPAARALAMAMATAPTARTASSAVGAT